MTSKQPFTKATQTAMQSELFDVKARLSVAESQLAEAQKAAERCWQLLADALREDAA